MPPPVMLFGYNTNHIDPSWLYSLKYDGIRVLWNGTHLLTRGGQRLADHPFTFPPGCQLDGELFARGGRHLARNTIHGLWPDNIMLHVFDAPDRAGVPFEDRYRYLQEDLQPHTYDPRVRVVAQTPVGTADIHELLTAAVATGHEGLIFRSPTHLPYVGRDCKHGCKLKPQLEIYASHTPNTNIFHETTPPYSTFKMNGDHSNIEDGELVRVTYSDRTSSGKPEFPRRG